MKLLLLPTALLANAFASYNLVISINGETGTYRSCLESQIEALEKYDYSIVVSDTNRTSIKYKLKHANHYKIITCSRWSAQYTHIITENLEPAQSDKNTTESDKNTTESNKFMTWMKGIL